ncbi:MAG: helix-turn-helix transcriptional regulator [Lachnospiraceae bacterium]|jgi:transcriptional regulator with XRE-family HTH domain|nr:helix-turn-helix transcriptional regulator [Lachnospiraceae bacterium]MCI8994744.1 helix-turn-helix transcriptional regulator [Lachnospiraceae bacterium]
MIFADKLIQLRKKNGWSQEELADQMHVTRQSVSKWEGAQSIPDMEKLIQLSRIFQVSLDYLLKEELGEEEAFPDPSPDFPVCQRVSMEEANSFLSIKAATAKTISLGVLLCVLSPICLLNLGALSEAHIGLSENMAGGLGLIILLVLVCIAVMIFLSCGSRTARFQYLETQIFETEYGVTGMVKERKNQYQEHHTRNLMTGVSICILSAIPLFCGTMILEDNDVFMTASLSLTIVLAGIGAMILTHTGIIWGSFQVLLEEEDYTRKNKKERTAQERISTIYWSVVTALYLGYSFVTGNWGYSWIIWPVAAVLYAAVLAIFGMFFKSE